MSKSDCFCEEYILLKIYVLQNTVKLSMGSVAILETRTIPNLSNSDQGGPQIPKLKSKLKTGLYFCFVFVYKATLLFLLLRSSSPSADR